MTARRVLLATWNPAKQDCLRGVLEGVPIEAVTPPDIGLEPFDVDEAGPGYQDNAVVKARAFAAASGLPALASDGGLEIPALGGCWDGLRSRRFAGPDDDARIRALLERMEGFPPERRTAFFREAVALVEPGGAVIASSEREGDAGRIAESSDPRRRSGFWVPSLWLYPPRWVTEWDLAGDERARIRTAWDAVADELRPALASGLPEGANISAYGDGATRRRGKDTSVRSIPISGRRLLAPLAAVLAVTLAGCNGSSVVPGLGGSGGLGTPGTGTGNPDGAMVFTLRGTNTGDFEASELRVQSNFLGFTVQGIQETGTTTNRVTRVATVRFPGLPVEGRTYVFTTHQDGDGTPEEEHAVIQYSEQPSANPRLWTGISGTVRVRKVTADHIWGAFEARLEPASAAAQGELRITNGEFVATYEPQPG